MKSYLLLYSTMSTLDYNSAVSCYARRNEGRLPSFRRVTDLQKFCTQMHTVKETVMSIHLAEESLAQLVHKSETFSWKLRQRSGGGRLRVRQRHRLDLVVFVVFSVPRRRCSWKGRVHAAVVDDRAAPAVHRHRGGVVRSTVERSDWVTGRRKAIRYSVGRCIGIRQVV